MKKQIPVSIDHFGIVCRDLDICRGVFAPFGFVNAGTSSLSVGIEGEEAPQNMHYVFDNCYIECIRSVSGDYLTPFLRSQAAPHILIMSAENISRTKEALYSEGFRSGEPMEASRGADHGEKKGTARFEWLRVEDGTLPGTLLGFIEHKTKELIYQPHRYQHSNKVYAVRALLVCYETEDEAAEAADVWEKLGNVTARTGDSRPSRIPFVEVYDKETFFRETGIHADPARSPYAGVDFLTEDPEAVRTLGQAAGCNGISLKDGVQFDLTEQINMVFRFRTAEL